MDGSGDFIPAYSGTPPQSADTRRNGLAVASLALGVVSLFTCGLLGVGAIAGCILGIVALSKIRKYPAEFTGTGFAIAGIVTSLVSFVPGLIAAIAIPNLLASQQYARERAALFEVKAICRAQLQYSSGKGKGRYADLQTLGAEGLIDAGLASGEAGGYQFKAEPLNQAGMPPMFDVTAKPVQTGRFGTGNRSFYSNETYLIYEAEGGKPPSTTLKDRVPKNGRYAGDGGLVTGID
ncbi:MAG TPA: DUF4190 domain-containing protein [Blastocatellia bacterium]|nr:DUF4190 domain-containing protein [Blastocatellia bacterium]